MIAHVVFTWLIANLIHPILFFGMGIFWGLSLNQEALEIMGSFLILSIVLSLPCLLICCLVFIPTIRADVPLLPKFLAWLAESALAISLIFSVLMFLTGSEINPEFFRFITPAILSAWIAILIRFKQFRSIIYKTERAKRDQ